MTFEVITATYCSGSSLATAEFSCYAHCTCCTCCISSNNPQQLEASGVCT